MPTQADLAAVGWAVAASGAHLNLLVGQLYFGDQAASVRTLLGSCVSLTLWHPVTALAGMCHFVLPTRARAADEPLDGRYGDEAVDLLVAAMLRAGTRPADYVAHLHGGAGVLEPNLSAPDCFAIGARNIAQSWSLVQRHGLTVRASDLGDRFPRTVRLWTANGRIDVQRGAALPPTSLAPQQRSNATVNPVPAAFAERGVYPSTDGQR